MKNELRLFFVWFLIFPASAAFADVSVFDRPRLDAEHQQILRLTEAAHRNKEYDEMAIAALAGIRLGSDDALWYYNLGCARALQHRPEEAFDALEMSVRAGFTDAAFMEKDKDLDSLRKKERYGRLLKQIAVRKAEKTFLPMIPDAQNHVCQTASNTVWNSASGLFESLIAPSVTTGCYAGPLSAELRKWTEEGTADIAFPVLYVNRDNNAAPPSEAAFPALIRLEYSREMAVRNLHSGLPNTMFINGKTAGYMPVIGGSSLRVIGAGFSQSLPLFCSIDQNKLFRQTLLLAANQLFFYPAGEDYTVDGGDRFLANQPVSLAVVGGPGGERPFIEAAAAAIAAMQPSVRDALIRRGALGTTLNMLFRATRKNVRTPSDYLSGRAHPPAFSGEQLDVPRLVRMAHALPDDIPDPAPLQVVSEPEVHPPHDFFDTTYPDEKLCTTPFCVARIFRGLAYTRTYQLKVTPPPPGSKIWWTILQGDRDKIKIVPDADPSAGVRITVAYHPAFRRKIPGDKRVGVPTSRIDIAAIIGKNGFYSMPSVFSVYFPPQETRKYADDGRLLSVDYTRRQLKYIHPGVVQSKNWRDDYLYSTNGVPLGWTRTRGLSKESFTPDGFKVVTRDARGRPALVHHVRYMPRFSRPLSSAADKMENSTPLRLELAEVDDNISFVFLYESDNDPVGKPVRAPDAPPCGG